MGKNLRITRCNDILCIDNEFRFLVGVNYWPRTLSIYMWREWNEDAIRNDVEAMKNLGIRAIRMFILTEDFAYEDGSIKRDSLEKLKRFLDILAQNNIIAFVTLIVGHMSGRNWRIPWTEPEKLYTSQSIEKMMKFISSIVSELKDHSAIGGWILGNEMSFVQRPSSRDEALSLLRAFSLTIKNVDRDHVVSSGDIPESYMQETPNVESIVDYIGLHLYLYDEDIARHGYAHSAMIELYRNADSMPVIVEEVGFSTYQYSEKSQAEFINEILYTSLAHGASGVFIWCFSDFIHDTRAPYEWRPLELGFGIIRRDGSPKPAAEVIEKFIKKLRDIERIGIHREYKKFVNTYIVVPFYLFKDYEFVEYRKILGYWGIVKPLISSYTLASTVNTYASMVYELDLEKILHRAKLVIVPSTLLSLSSTWRKLLEYTYHKGHLYVSTYRGFGEFRACHESTTHLWNELFGVELNMDAGLTGYRLHKTLTIEFIKDFGNLRKGSKLQLRLRKPIYTYRCRPIDADVVAVDDNGEPLIFKARRDSGTVILSLIPIEVIFTMRKSIDWNSSPEIMLYNAIITETGIPRPYRANHGDVELILYRGRNRDSLFVVNHGDFKDSVRVLSSEEIDRVDVLCGNAELKNYDHIHIELLMPRKSGIVLLISRREVSK